MNRADLIAAAILPYAPRDGRGAALSGPVIGPVPVDEVTDPRLQRCGGPEAGIPHEIVDVGVGREPDLGGKVEARELDVGAAGFGEDEGIAPVFDFEGAVDGGGEDTDDRSWY